METPAPYRYSKLQAAKSIRILHVTGGRGSTLFAELTEARLNDKPQYGAISYVWGNPDKSHTLSLRGGGIIKITASLYNALRSIRRSEIEDGPRSLWADGVCINQDDLEERSQQVKLMADIYSSATCVITYVGEDTANIQQGLALARSLIACSSETGPFPSKETMASVYRKHRIPSLHDPIWNSLGDFLCRSWYTRVWIVQESLRNSNMIMMCGKTTIPWELFTRLVGMMTTGLDGQFRAIQPKSEAQIGALSHMARMREEYQSKEQSALELLASTRELSCSEPRDHVFGLASLIKDIEISADYKIPTSQVFTETAIELIRTCGLIVLSYAGINRGPGVPSWVPDWSKRQQQIPVFQARRFSASGDIRGSFQFMNVSIDSNYLRVPVIIHNRVVHVTDTLRRTFVVGRMSRYA